MSETPSAPSGSLMRKKVAGVPMLYLAIGAALILVMVAYRMKNVSAATQATKASAGTDPNATDGTLEGTVPDVPHGTVVAAPSSPVAAPVAYQDNSTWMRQGVAYLIAHGVNPGAAQLALQHYLSGDDLTYQEGQYRDMVVREYNIPPDGFDAGNTASRVLDGRRMYPGGPVPTNGPPRPTVPVPAPHNPVAVPKPVAPTTKYVIVRSGDTLSSLASRYGKTWEQIYALPQNRATIGADPNLIKPGQRLVIP